jgi:hypothetical protein
VIFSLEAIRTDGWFERVGERVGSFQALCDIVGERFFAFSLITGARITALTVDRRNPAESLVDFEVEGGSDADRQRLSLRRFRQRLVNALVSEESYGPIPSRDTDVEAVQLYIGVRYLLLAPLYGLSLLELLIDKSGAHLTLSNDGVEEEYELEEFRRALRSLVVEELDRVTAEAPGRAGIDPSVIPQAEAAANQGDHGKVLELLGNWAMPLTLLLRTPNGQMLNEETRALLGGALGLLGMASLETGEVGQAEDVLRLAVQYTVDTAHAAPAYARLGIALLRMDRPAEAIAPLRRAVNLGAPAATVWPPLGEALLARNRLLAALGAVEEAVASGVSDPRLDAVRAQVRARLPELSAWEALLGRPVPAR